MPKALKSCPKSNILPKLVTLVSCYIHSCAIKYLSYGPLKPTIMIKELRGCHHGSMDSSAPSILPPGFESKEHHQCFYQCDFCHIEKTKINKKVADFGPLKATTMIEELCVSAYFYQQSWVIIGRHVSTPLVRFQLLTTGSVTEWPDYGFNIWPFSAMKICPKAYKLYQSELKTLPKTK